MSNRELFRSATRLGAYELKNDGLNVYDTNADLDEFTVRNATPSSDGSMYKSTPVFANEWIARARTGNIESIGAVLIKT